MAYQHGNGIHFVATFVIVIDGWVFFFGVIVAAAAPAELGLASFVVSQPNPIQSNPTALLLDLDSLYFPYKI